jgi:hypothetical protein
MRLKNVDLPVFGIPNRATRFIREGLTGLDGDFFRFPAAQHNVGRTDAYLHGAGKFGVTYDLDPFADPETQCGEAVIQVPVSMYCGNGGSFTRLEISQLDSVSHGHTPLQLRMVLIILLVGFICNYFFD